MKSSSWGTPAAEITCRGVGCKPYRGITPSLLVTSGVRGILSRPGGPLMRTPLIAAASLLVVSSLVTATFALADGGGDTLRVTLQATDGSSHEVAALASGRATV